jgi:hypothetical protein
MRPMKPVGIGSAKSASKSTSTLIFSDSVVPNGVWALG